LKAAPNLFVEIQASGVLRRLSQCDSEEQSPFFRGLMRPTDPALKPIGYWPCENVDNGDAILAAGAGLGTPLVVNKSTDGLGTRSGFLGSEQIVTLKNSQLYADIPTYSPSGTLMLVGALVRLPDSGVGATNTPIMVVNTTGTAAYWRVRANTDGTLNVQVADPLTDGGLGGVIVTSANTSWNIQGRTAYVALTLEEFGSTVVWNLFAWPEYGTTGLNMSGTVASRTFGRVWRMTFGSGGNAGDTAIGHIAAWKYNAALPAYIQNLVNGWRGELAARRVARIAREEGIVLAVLGSTSYSLPMIQQGAKSGLDLMTEAVEADGGVLYEPTNVPTVTVADGEDSTVGDLTSFGGPTLVSSTTQAHTGARSVRITWGSSLNIAQAVEDFFIVGYVYTWTVWVYVPTGQPAVKLGISGGATSSPTTLTNTWQKLTLAWTATSYTHTVQILPSVSATAGQLCYVDDAIITVERAGLHYVPLNSLYNQTAALTLNYTAAEIHDIVPTDDDRYLVNDAKVSIEGIGDPARVSLDTGPLSTAAPPNGAGRYTTSANRNVLTGDLAFNWARWLVHLGTWNEPRYPEIQVNLNRKRALIANATLVEPGSVIIGTNPPAWLPPQQIKQLVFGLSETINVRTWMVTYNCAPGRPFDVFTLDSDRLATESTLAASTTAPAAGTSMTISVTSTAAGGRWTTTAGDFPFTIMVAPVEGMIGEEMTVTNITGTGLTQTFTVTRGVNGITVAWASGSAVSLSRRPTLALGP